MCCWYNLAGYQNLSWLVVWLTPLETLCGLSLTCHGQQWLATPLATPCVLKSLCLLSIKAAAL